MWKLRHWRASVAWSIAAELLKILVFSERMSTHIAQAWDWIQNQTRRKSTHVFTDHQTLLSFTFRFLSLFAAVRPTKLSNARLLTSSLRCSRVSRRTVLTCMTPPGVPIKCASDAECRPNQTPVPHRESYLCVIRSASNQ